MITKCEETAPARIWLCVSDEPLDAEWKFPADASQVTWAKGYCPTAVGVEYVRATDAAKLSAALDRISFQPMGKAEASDREVLDCITNIARAALDEYRNAGGAA